MESQILKSKITFGSSLQDSKKISASVPLVLSPEGSGEMLDSWNYKKLNE